MSIANIKKKLFGLSAWLFLAASVIAILPITPTYAASNPQIVSKSCIANGYATKSESPFIPGMCLGTDSQSSSTNARQFWQFVVYFSNPVKSAVVSGKNANGDVIKFARDTKTGSYVSLPDASGNAYNVPIGTSSANCTPSKYTSITINASGNGATQTPFSVDLCKNIGDSNSLLYFNANMIPGDGGKVSTIGTITGMLGVKRENTNISRLQKGLADKSGVVSLTLTGTTADGKTITPITGDQNSPNSLYSLSGGNFSMPVQAGTYNLEIVYDDGAVIQNAALSGPGGQPSMTSRNIDYSWTGIKVPPGGSVCVDNQPVCSGVYYISSNVTVSTVHAKPPSTPQNDCAIQGIGWIICPIINFMAGANDTLYGIISGLLQTNVSSLSTDSKVCPGNFCAAFNSWQIMRNFANVGFVIVFLIIIFSQISSLGISNYGVKKMLPRLIVAAVLVNASFIICQVAVDVSNIVGGSIVSLFDNTAVFGAPSNWTDSGTGAGGAVGLAAGVLAGTAVIGGTAAIAIMGTASLLLPVLAAALIAVIVTLLILVTRNVAIILLVILSPLAFLAMLLPNTEPLFKKWRQILVAMLVVYPMIGLLFGASTLASKIIVQSGGTLQQIIGIIVLFLPLILTPFLLQNALKAVPVLGNFASKMASRANQNLGKSAQKRLRPVLNSALSNRTAGLTWGGKERYKKAKRNEDGYEVERDASGALVPKKDELGNLIRKKGGAKLDEHGNIVTPKKRTFSQVLDQAGKRYEKNIETNKAVADNSFTKEAIDGRTRNARASLQILDRGKSAHVEAEAQGKILEGRLKSRQLTHGTVESRIHTQLEDAEGTIGVLNEQLSEEGKARIENNEENTVARAIGVAGSGPTLMINHEDENGVKTTGAEQVSFDRLGSMSMIGAAAEGAAKASEKTIEADIEDSGVKDASTFKTQTADARLATSKADEDAKLAKRQSAKGAVDPITGESTGEAGDLYEKYVKEQDTSKLEKEVAEAANKEALGQRMADQNDLLGLADEKAVLEESAAGGDARAKGRIAAAKAGREKQIENMDPEAQKKLAEAGLQQAIGSRNQSLAEGVAGVVRAQKIVDEGANGELSNLMAGTELGISTNTNVEDAKAGETLQADRSGDVKAYRDSHRQENLSSTDIYTKKLNLASPDKQLDFDVDNFTPKTSDELPLAEEIASIEDIVQFGGADDNDRLFTYSSKLTKMARQAEEAAAGAMEIPEESRTPAQAKLVEDAKTARERSRTIHSTLQRAWASNPSQRPMQYGGSLEQYFAQDTEERSRREIMADRLGGGKYDSRVGTNNIDRLKALEKQIESYRDDPSLFTKEFTSAFQPTAKYNVETRLKEGYPDNAAWEAAVKDGSWKAAVDAAVPEELDRLLTKQKIPGFASFLLTVDEALDSTTAPELSPEKRDKLKQTRDVLIEALNNNAIPLPQVQQIDPNTGKPAVDAQGNPIYGNYRRRSPGEYNLQG